MSDVNRLIRYVRSQLAEERKKNEALGNLVGGGFVTDGNDA